MPIYEAITIDAAYTRMSLNQKEDNSCEKIAAFTISIGHSIGQ